MLLARPRHRLLWVQNEHQMAAKAAHSVENDPWPT